MDLRIDHVATAWADLTGGERACDAVGMPTTEGGEHADGTTEMRLVAFPDGTYLELITNTGEATPARWPSFIAGDAGPAAWCVEVDDLRSALASALSADVRVSGPDRDGRARPDGIAVEWETAVLGDSLGATLPFLIEDRTPRTYRVAPDPELVGGPLRGIAEVVVLADDARSLTAKFDRLFRLPRPSVVDADEFGATIQRFAGAGVALAEPASDRLADRLAEYGPAPCAVLVETDDIDEARDRFAVSEPTRWGDDDVAWFDHPALEEWLGVVEYAH